MAAGAAAADLHAGRGGTGMAMTGGKGTLPASDLLALWDDRLSTAARNLTDLNDTPEMSLVRSGLAGGGRPWTGRTRSEAMGVVAAMDGLWQLYLVVSSVVRDAREASRRLALPSQRDADVRRLLDGLSVRIPSAEVPVGARGLLDAAVTEERMTLDDALARMSGGFDAARSATMAVSAADRALAGRLASLASRAAALAAWQAGNPWDAGHAPLPGPASGWAAASDPLGAAGELDDVSATLDAADVARRAASADIAAFHAAAALTRDAISALAAREVGIPDAVAALAGVDCPAPGFPPPAAVRLSEWLERVTHAVALGRVRAARVGLAKLSGEVASVDGTLLTALAVARAPLAELEDLRGVFRALRAKSVLAGNADADVLEASAKVELRRVPVRLAEARRLVSEFERALAARPVGRPVDGGMR